ncbi:hypothetical protein V8E54_013074 [Elaphomyces granulatus]|jgi:hypothetical protein
MTLAVPDNLKESRLIKNAVWRQALEDQMRFFMEVRYHGGLKSLRLPAELFPSSSSVTVLVFVALGIDIVVLLYFYRTVLHFPTMLQNTRSNPTNMSSEAGPPPEAPVIASGAVNSASNKHRREEEHETLKRELEIQILEQKLANKKAQSALERSSTKSMMTMTRTKVR